MLVAVRIVEQSSVLEWTQRTKVVAENLTFLLR